MRSGERAPAEAKVYLGFFCLWLKVYTERSVGNEQRLSPGSGYRNL